MFFACVRVNALIGTHKDHLGAAVGENPAGDNTRNLIDPGFERFRVAHVKIGHIENAVPVIGRKVAFDGIAAHGTQGARDTSHGHRNHFHGKRDMAEGLTVFAFIDNANEFFRNTRDNLFTR